MDETLSSVEMGQSITKMAKHRGGWKFDGIDVAILGSVFLKELSFLATGIGPLRNTDHMKETLSDCPCLGIVN